jgi:ABC-type antimicrobial peptide transport system permease subunit
VILFRANYEHTSAIYVKYQPGTTKASLAALAQVYKKFEPDITLKYRFQDDTFDEIYKTEITSSRLVLVFTAVTLIVCIMGIAGLATYNVVRRTKEIGIRRVFGASVTQVMQLLTNEFSLTLIFAMLLAAPLAWLAADRWLMTFAYRIAMPWWAYAATFFSIAVVVIAIICMQGLKTVTTTPTKTLRNE